ncbi:MAG: hypothetical protein BWY17_00564 [Deltaproteobacteria bacterium ADurb.Bin207]|jgi:hypothetical protein|nr:MAG: hypothetical protein BWY17_00564 [Deltaproteobacteria bacterium ADurb.Bin207]
MPSFVVSIRGHFPSLDQRISPFGAKLTSLPHPPAMYGSCNRLGASTSRTSRIPAYFSRNTKIARPTHRGERCSVSSFLHPTLSDQRTEQRVQKPDRLWLICQTFRQVRVALASVHPIAYLRAPRGAEPPSYHCWFGQSFLSLRRFHADPPSTDSGSFEKLRSYSIDQLPLHQSLTRVAHGYPQH